MLCYNILIKDILMKKRLLFGLILALGGAGIWLTKTEPAPSSLEISGPFEFNSQDLAKDGFLFSRLQVVESLVGINENSQPYPLLAKSWTVSDDGLVWRFQIRPEVQFHDGSQLTAQAAATALNHALGKPGVIKQVPIKAITAQNDQVVIELNTVYRPLAAVLAHYSLAIASPSSYDASGNVIRLLGTGPYQIAQLQAPHKASVIRFNAYWGKPASIETINYLAGHRSESRALLAKTGQADLVYTLDPISIPSLQQSHNLDLYIESMPRTVLIKLNNEHPLLNHADVRQAISLAINREGIAQSVLKLPGSEAHQLFSPALGAWHLAEKSQPQRHLATAQTLLANQGWTLNDQGLLEREGQAFRVQLLTYADRPELPLIATALQAQLKEIGIQVDIAIDNSSAIPAKHHDGTLEMALIARNFGTIADPLPLLLSDFATHQGSDWGPTNWSSPQFSQLLAELSTESDNTRYQQLAAQASQLLADEMPLIPVTYYRQIVSVNKRVAGFSFDPFEINYRVAQMSFND
ncbi:ABC transporter substrate-binding protein [Vibrio cholerae]|nr:ABC transporter substrate-binding protein [Vibrio cholerae]